MSVSFKDIIDIQIPQGNVDKIIDASGNILWQKNGWIFISDDGDLNDIIYANGKFVAVGFKSVGKSNETTIRVSSDGLTWNYATKFNSSISGTEGIELINVVYGNGKYVAIDRVNNSRIYASSDGFTWNEVYKRTDSLNGTVYLDRIIYDNNIFVAVGPRQVIISTNGTTWTPKFDNSIPGIDVAYGNGIFVIPNTTKVLTTTDKFASYSFTSVSLGKSVRKIIYANNKFIIIGDEGLIATSTNGTSWTTQSSGVTDDLISVAYGNGKYVIGSNMGYVLTSSTGTSWTKYKLLDYEVYNRIHSVRYLNNQFIVCTHNNVIGMSSNGVDWKSYNVSGSWLNESAYGANNYIVVSDRDGIFRYPVK